MKCRHCGQAAPPRQRYCSDRCLILDNHRKLPNGCWEWTGARNDNNYGTHGKRGRAHRTSLEAFKGPIPAGLLALHRCRYRPCVNPDHLRAGTQSQNILDAIEHGTHYQYFQGRVGEMNHNTSLTDDDVRAIRADPRKQSEIAADYGISQMTVSRIKRRIHWSHVP